MEDGFEESGDVDCVYVVMHYQREGEVLKYRRLIAQLNDHKPKPRAGPNFFMLFINFYLFKLLNSLE